MGNKPDWEKTYNLQNCEVVGYCKLTDLKADSFGNKNYSLMVLIDKKNGEKIKKEIEKVIEETAEDYGKEPAKCTKITNVIKLEKDKKTGKVINRITCDSDKLVLNLQTNSKDGCWLVPIFDAKNKPLEKVNLYEGSIVNVLFQASSYAAKDAGVSIKLKSVQVVKAVTGTVKNDITESPFDVIEGADELEDEYVDGADDDEEAEEL